MYYNNYMNVNKKINIGLEAKPANPNLERLDSVGSNEKKEFNVEDLAVGKINIEVEVEEKDDSD